MERKKKGKKKGKQKIKEKKELERRKENVVRGRTPESVKIKQSELCKKEKE